MAPGYVAWEGPSLLDGEPIVAIVTTESQNRKTGSMEQVWFMRADIDPVTCENLGYDSVCKNCIHHKIKSCYVWINQAPLLIWRKYKRNKYIQGIPPMRAVRLGAFGDPASVPRSLLDTLIAHSVYRWTGYTHEWRTRPDLKNILMASCDTPDDFYEATELGWSTFRCRLATEPLLPSESECPKYCITCNQCNGKNHTHISTIVHGYRAKRYINWRTNNCTISYKED